MAPSWLIRPIIWLSNFGKSKVLLGLLLQRTLLFPELNQITVTAVFQDVGRIWGIAFHMMWGHCQRTVLSNCWRHSFLDSFFFLRGGTLSMVDHARVPYTNLLLIDWLCQLVNDSIQRMESCWQSLVNRIPWQLWNPHLYLNLLP